MKFSLPILAVCATAVMAAATPDGGWDLSQIDESGEDVEDAILEITDEHFGDKVFKGTYDSIIAEMQELKPELFDEEAAHVENSDITPIDNPLTKRAYNIVCRQDYLVRKNFECLDPILRFQKISPGISAYVNGKKCARLACHNGCGIYACNKYNNKLWVNIRATGWHAQAIFNKCNRPPVSGRNFFRTHFVSIASC